MQQGIHSIQSKRRMTGPNHNPFVALARNGCTEETGEAYGFNLIYSGNFAIDIETDTRGCSRLLMGINPIACIVICIGKGAAAGWISGLVYRLLAKKSELAGVVTAGVVCPIVNTGILVIGLLLFFNSTIQSWAGGQNMLYYVIFGLMGINFVVELLVNLVLSSGITSVIKYAGKGRN